MKKITSGCPSVDVWCNDLLENALNQNHIAQEISPQNPSLTSGFLHFQHPKNTLWADFSNI